MSRDELLKLLLEGKSTRKIAEELGIGKSTVGYWINKYNLNEFMKYQPHKENYNFEKIDTKEKAYTLGFILADGSISLKNLVELGVEKNDVQSILTLTLKYGKNKERVITGLKRISKPGLRVYASVDNIPSVRQGLGIAIISTSQGIMTDKEARKNNHGGEVLAYVW